MRSQIILGRGRKSLLAAFSILAVLVVSAAPAWSADDVCAGYPVGKKLTKLGGPNAFAPSVSTLEELQARLDILEPDIRYVLEQNGQAHLAEGILDAIRSGRVKERNLRSGEIFQWMAFRKKGEPQSYGDLCLALRAPYPAWEIQVVTEEEMGGQPPACGATVRRDCQGGLEVEATGHESTSVSMGSENLVSGAGKTWSGSDSNPFTEDLSFQVAAESRGTKKVTTANFVLPKICSNLAYVGSTTENVPGAAIACSKTVTVDRCDAPDPACSIMVTPAEARVKKPVQVTVDGHWADGGLEMAITDSDGDAVSEPSMTGSSGSLVFPSSGSYTLTGTATNEAGETATCSAIVEIEPSWAVRVFGAKIDPKSNNYKTDLVRDDDTIERSSFGIEDGVGIGASAERYFGERTGLEFGFIYALGGLDSSYQLDLNEAWGMTKEDLDMLTLDLGFNFHLTPDSAFDLFIGPFVSYVSLDGGNYTTLGETFSPDFDSEFGFGLKAGVDIPFGADNPWGAHLGARYMDLQVESSTPERFELELDPFILTAGLSYHF